MDIYQYIKVDTTDVLLSGGAGHRILQIYFYSTNNEFWIDEVSIHQSVSSNWELLQDQGIYVCIRVCLCMFGIYQNVTMYIYLLEYNYS